MAEKGKVILGISLGTRRVGLAICTRNGLIDWRMRIFKETYSRKKVKRIWRVIEQAIERYGVTAVGMKIPHKSLRSEGINQCLKEITTRIVAKDIPLYFYEIETIEGYYLKSKVKNKTALAEVIAEKYPLLKNEYFRLGKSKYNMKIFEAIAVMELALLQLL